MKPLRTTDLALASYLRSEGFVHYAIEMIDDHRAVWVFEQLDPISQKLVATYKSGEALINPATFLQITRKVRDELYAHIRAHTSS